MRRRVFRGVLEDHERRLAGQPTPSEQRVEQAEGEKISHAKPA